MPLTLSLRTSSTIPIEVDGVLPETLHGKSRVEIDRWPVFQGNRRLTLADLFEIEGEANDERLKFRGDCHCVHRIGAGMTRGEIVVAGPAGRHLGSEMAGGKIFAQGDASDWVGAMMRGGLIHVHGSAGNNVGAAYRGAERGMTGGVILVDGDAGSEVGHTMRRGLVAIGGRCGDFAAMNMIAGSVFVFGDCGQRPAAGMQRGTLAAFGARPRLLPTFRSGGMCRPLFVQIYLRKLCELGFAAAAAYSVDELELFHGDLLTVGRGEILVRG